MWTPKTYFEQVPVEIVKKIAKPMFGDDLEKDPSGSLEAANQKNWLELAQLVQREQDPAKVVGLVEQLIETFDAEKARGRAPSGQANE
jgi:hypothetical protein